jgi:hypothetical protein
MRCTGEWCARRLKAPSRRSERSTRGNGRSWIPVKDAIDRMLVSDRQAPRKQHHTAHRIWTRLHEEHPSHPIAEPTVRRYVQRRKQELGLSSREVFVLQSYDWGQEAQVDWFEAVAKLDGEPYKLQ